MLDKLTRRAKDRSHILLRIGSVARSLNGFRQDKSRNLTRQINPIALLGKEGSRATTILLSFRIHT